MGIANRPQDLIVGFETVLQEIGTTDSFLGPEYARELNAEYLWNLVFSGILNEKSQEGTLFKENLSEQIKNSEEAIKKKIKLNLQQYTRANYVSFEQSHESSFDKRLGGFMKAQSSVIKQGSCHINENGVHQPSVDEKDKEKFMRGQLDLARRMTM